MKKRKFKGDQKKGSGILSEFDNWFAKKLIPLVPNSVQTYHLTYTTILWSGLIILGGYLANSNLKWLIFVSLMIFLQYITDLVDGKIGKERNTGLIQWGYYMDHFLDYIFLCSIIISYSLMLSVNYDFTMLLILVIFGAFMVNSFLSFSATTEFRIHYLKIGPTEIRLVFIIINTLIVLFGKSYMIWALPYVLTFSFLGLILVIYKTQKSIWKLDEKIKGKEIN